MDLLNTIDRALKYIAETDDEMAELEANVKLYPDRIKAKKSAIFLDSVGTDGQKKAKADVLIYEDPLMGEYESDVRKYNQLRNRRERAHKVIMYEQTKLSARSRGLVV